LGCYFFSRSSVMIKASMHFFGRFSCDRPSILLLLLLPSFSSYAARSLNFVTGASVSNWANNVASLACEITNVSSLTQTLSITAERGPAYYIGVSPPPSGSVRHLHPTNPLPVENKVLAPGATYAIQFYCTGLSFYIPFIPRSIRFQVTEDRGALLGGCLYQSQNGYQGIVQMNSGRPF